VYEIIKRRANLTVEEVVGEARKHDIGESVVKDTLRVLLGKGHIYRPRQGFVEVVEV